MSALIVCGTTEAVIGNSTGAVLTLSLIHISEPTRLRRSSYAFFCYLVTPGSGNVVRIVNTAPVEFPMTASVVPHTINADMPYGGDVVLGGDA